MKRDLTDATADIVFWPWNLARGRGRLIGWPLMLLGALWLVVLIIPVMFPALIIETIRGMDRDLRGRSRWERD